MGKMRDEKLYQGNPIKENSQNNMYFFERSVNELIKPGKLSLKKASGPRHIKVQ